MSIPPSAPAEAPKTTPSAAPEAKITLDTKDKLADFKKLLKIDGKVDTTQQKEIKEIEEKFNAEKDKILTISQQSIDALKADINDSDETLGKKLDVKDGELVFSEAKTVAEPTRPEAPIEKKIQELPLVDIAAPIPDETQKNIAELKTQDKPGWYRFVEALSRLPLIGGFFAGFLGLNEGEKLQDIDRDINMISTLLTKVSGDQTLVDRLTQGMFSEKKSLISAIRSQPELLRGPNIDPKKLQTYLAYVLQQEPITGGDIYGFLVGQITSYPASEVNLTGNTQSENNDVANTPPLVVPMNPSSPEVQTELMTKATEVDEALTKAKAMPEGTPEQKNTKTEAVKSAQEAVNTFKDQRKSNILSQYTSLKDRIKESEIERDTLKVRNSPEESEKKKLTEINKDLEKLRRIESAMKTKIEEVMIQKDDKWEIREGIDAQKMTSVEIALSAIENNTASVENQEVSREEKEKQEKIILDLEKEVEATLYGGGSDWKENYRIDRPEDVEQLEKKISDIKSLPLNDILKEKIAGIEKKLQTARLKIEAVKAFLKHARGLVKNENEMPEYGDDKNDFIHVGNISGEIDINTELASGFWGEFGSTWADEVWKLDDNQIKISNALGGDQEFVNVIKANIEGLRKNTGLFIPKKGGDKFTILG